jgi:hypothetical protein
METIVKAHRRGYFYHRRSFLAMLASVIAAPWATKKVKEYAAPSVAAKRPDLPVVPNEGLLGLEYYGPFTITADNSYIREIKTMQQWLT